MEKQGLKDSKKAKTLGVAVLAILGLVQQFGLDPVIGAICIAGMTAVYEAGQAAIDCVKAKRPE